MYKGKKILVVIPARGGSKGIPRKNVRMLAGKPLIAYSIQTALSSKYVDGVVLTTDDEEIKEVAKIFGAEVVERPGELAEDDVPLDPVIFHALTCYEDEKGVIFNYIVSLQPTSPLLRTKSLDKAISEIVDSGRETLIGVKDETHLYWTKKNNVFLPLYTQRLNRQFLDPIYKETGLFISRRDIITEHNRIGSEIHIFEIPFEESIDIDSNIDWLIAEKFLKQIKVVFRVDADNKLGLGHIYRCITLANRMVNNVCFLMDESKTLGIRKVKEYNHKLITFKNETDLFHKLSNIKPDIIINDILDTTTEYIMDLNKIGFYIVNFEDLGSGSRHADLLINALYERTEPPENSYFGHKYICLRDEFSIFPPKLVKEEVKEILIIFGGTDPNNLTLRTLKSIEKLDLKNIKINIILGLGYLYHEQLSNYLKELKKKGFIICLYKNIKIVAKYMSKSDIAITSNGRTIYEIAAMGVPCISISQNEREMRHLFSFICGGIKNLGIASNITVRKISTTLKEVIDNYELRQKMSESMKDFNLKKGTDRVINLIFDKYWEKMSNEKNQNTWQNP